MTDLKLNYNQLVSKYFSHHLKETIKSREMYERHKFSVYNNSEETYREDHPAGYEKKV